VAQLIAVALVVGSANVIFSVANSTLLPAIVPREELARRNSLGAASTGVAQLAGPGLGGVLVDVMGAASCMVIDAVSYLFSAVMLGGLPRPDSQPVRPQSPPFRRELADGFAYIRSEPVLKAGFLLGCAVNPIASAVIALSPLFIVRTLHEASYVLGLVYAAEGAGALVGAALAPRLSDSWGSAKTTLRCALALPLAVLLLPFAFHGAGALLFGLGIFWFALTMTVAAIAIVTHRHRTVPSDKLALMLAITHVFSWGGAPLGALVAGGLATTLGIRAALFAIAAMSVVVPLSVWTSHEIRRRSDLEDDAG
jgi:predicted MFS family arabinose efflux permease